MWVSEDLLVFKLLHIVARYGKVMLPLLVNIYSFLIFATPNQTAINIFYSWICISDTKKRLSRNRIMGNQQSRK